MTLSESETLVVQNLKEPMDQAMNERAIEAAALLDSVCPVCQKERVRCECGPPLAARVAGEDAKSIGRQIAKILDEEHVKPPLRLQAWDRIHKLLEATRRAEP